MANNGNLNQKLWNSADILRSKMDANEYKSYLLGLIFYKFLSDNLLYSSADLIGEEVENLQEAQKVYEEAYNSEDKEDLIQELDYQYSYYIKPELTFTSFIEQIDNRTFQLESLQQGFRDIEQSSEAFENLFEDVDLYSKRLGNTPQKQNQVISEIMKELAPLDLSRHDGDVLGDAYEYLIGQFASDSGKKAGEFYTPQPVSKLMTQIIIHGKENKRGFTVYDPTMGERVIIVTRCINAFKLRVSETLTKYISSLLRVIKV